MDKEETQQRKRDKQQQPPTQPQAQVTHEFADVVTTLNALNAREKNLTVDRKTAITETIDKIHKTFMNMHTEITILKTENATIKRTATTVGRSYAQASAVSVQQIPEKIRKQQETKRHTAFITAEGKKAKELQKIITTEVKPAKYRICIKHIRTTYRVVIVETDSDNDIKKLQEHQKLKEHNIKVDLPRKRNPLVIMYDVPSNMKNDEIEDNIYH